MANFLSYLISYSGVCVCACVGVCVRVQDLQLIFFLHLQVE